MVEKWVIEARAFLLWPVPLAHHFWVLANRQGHVAGQLHGLATDPRTGKAKAIGHSGHLLQAYSDATICWSLQPDQPKQASLTGEAEIVLAHWQAALNAIPAINALQLRYPNLWQHFRCPNSNSIFSLFAAVMALQVPDRLLPANAFAVGLHTPISQEIIERYRVRSPERSM